MDTPEAFIKEHCDWCGWEPFRFAVNFSYIDNPDPEHALDIHCCRLCTECGNGLLAGLTLVLLALGITACLILAAVIWI